MVQYSGSVNLEINQSTAKKNPALKFFQCLQFSNFVNLRIYAIFPLSHNIQGQYIWKSTNLQQKNPALKIFHFLQFSNFVNLRIYEVFHLWYNIQYMYIWKSTTKKSSFKNFSVCPISSILSIYESTRFFTYGTIFRIC